MNKRDDLFDTEDSIESNGDLEAAPERDGASSLTRMLHILDFFTESAPIWSTTDIIKTLGASRSTGYRYIKALTSAGLLSAVGNGYYMLGSRIIELDLQIRRSDPLLQASKGILSELVDATGHTALLCMLFQNSVLCVDEKLAPLSPVRLFSRGQRRPMFRGAVSKVILAHLPNHRLRSIYTRREDTIRDAGLGDSWSKFRESLAQIRSKGYVKSVGEFIPDNVGIAAPIFNVDGQIIGSVGIACSKDEMREGDQNRSILSVRRAAKEISQRMSSEDSGLVLPPRAVG